MGSNLIGLILSKGLVVEMDKALAEHIMPRQAEFVASGIWDDERFGLSVAERAAANPNNEAVVDRKGKRRITYGELDVLSNQAANMLIDAGVEPGDVVAVQLPNCIEAAVLGVAISKVGAIINPMMTLYREKELKHMLGTTQAKVIFTPDFYRKCSHRDLLVRVTGELDHELKTIVIDVPENDADGPSEWLDSLSQWSDTPVAVERSAADVSVVLFTSGTEKAPKAVMHTEQTLNSNIRAGWKGFELGDDEVCWMPSPVGHSTGYAWGIRVALQNGAKLILQDRWTPEEGVATVERERPTYTLSATIFLTDMLSIAEQRAVDLSSLRVFGCGGAPVPAEVVNAAADNGINVLRLYGQTETEIATMNTPSCSLDKLINTDGAALEGFKIDIRNEAGESLPAGTEGELCVTGPGVSVGYFQLPEQTLSKFRNGWVYTGDIAVMDEDGYITIVGRKSEIIIRGGLNITPREVEEAIIPIKGVSAVAIVGLPHNRLGEQCCACIIPEEGVEITLDNICDELRSRGVSAYKLPERLEIFEEFPMTASGKVQRHNLAKILKAKDSQA
ncbi:MAG: AMP-binding protein [Gammaproteobacteria bacterium]|nr:AMP-binding protein [Gammaproteobacteria bacterium]